MLYINPDNKNIKDISEIHFNVVKCLIRKKIGSKLTCSDKCLICEGGINKITNVSLELTNILQDESNLRRLLLAKPSDLIIENDFIFNLIFPDKTLSDIKSISKKKKDYDDDQNIKEVSKRKRLEDLNDVEKVILERYQHISKIVDYENWFNKLPANAEYGPYKLSKELNIRSCTYCNRQYTLTIESNTNESGKLTRPQFDHWISKDKYPLLGLSFYNLIPSCPTCNSSVKGNTKFNTDEYTHPYIDNFIDNIHFSFDYWASIKGYQVNIGCDHPDSNQKDRILKTIKAFKIDEVYNGHHPELDDLIQISKAYSPSYLEILKSSFPGANLSSDQIYRYAFGAELNSDDFHKRPLSKFKYDILKELGIIKMNPKK